MILDDLKAGTAGVVCLALGLLAGGVTVRIYDSWIVIPEAEEAAAEKANGRWKDAVAAAEKEAERQRQKAEDEIAEAERDFIAKDAARASQMTALEQSLEQELARAPILPSSGGAAACGPAIPRGVRDALQRLGRTAVRPPAGEPDAPLRPSG